MKSSKALRLGALALGCMAASTAWSQDRGAYLGASYGRSSFADSCEGVSISCDKSDKAWKVFGGWQFTPGLAAEIGYVDFGEAVARGTIGGANVDANSAAKAWELAGIGQHNLGQLGLYAKLGFYRAKTDVHATATVPGFSSSGNTSGSNTDLTFGAGLRFGLTPNLALQGEWQRYNDVGNNDTGKTDIDLLSLGLLFRFR